MSPLDTVCGGWAPLLAAIALLAATWSAAPARAAEVRATVVWARGTAVYVACADSGAIPHGAQLEFLDHGHERARGEATDVLQGTLVVARITSGSLEHVKKLEKLRVSVEPVAATPNAGRLVIGVPSVSRHPLLDLFVRARPFHLEGCADESLSADSRRFVVIDPAFVRSRWPDTVVVRSFREAIDEEIALQRGELDEAVFWPGEASARLRETPLGANVRLVEIPGCALEARLSVAQDTLLGARVRTDLARLNQQFFSGDLRASAPEPVGTMPARPARYVLDVPHAPATLERFFASLSFPGPAPEVRVAPALAEPASTPAADPAPPRLQARLAVFRSAAARASALDDADLLTALGLAAPSRP